MLAPHFGDPAAELRAALESCALVDRSARARLLGTGPDLLGLLQRLSTGDVATLSPGAGAATVLTTNKGRIVERLFVSHLGAAGVLLVGSSGAGPRVLAHLRRYTFSERTDLEDVTAATALFALVGPQAAEALESAGLSAPTPCGAREATIAGVRVHVVGHDGVSRAGFAVVLPEPQRAPVWEALAGAVRSAGGLPVGDEASAAQRILLGVPDAPGELNDEHNPLEAGLWDAVAFDKGCYVGQEVVARLRTYDKVSRRLFLLRFPGDAPDTGARLLRDGAEIGAVTSAVRLPGTAECACLAYVKTRAAAAGDEVEVQRSGGAVRSRLLAPPNLAEETP